jgi:hypothetical protein
MSDGPFKNLKLGHRWKRFAEAAQNDAFDSSECYAMASDALVREILADDLPSLLRSLQSFASDGQMDLDPSSSVERIFNLHNKSQFADDLQKTMSFHLNDKKEPDDALKQALNESVVNQTNAVKNHINEECIRAFESAEMKRDQFELAIKRSSEILDKINIDDICSAIFANDKNAFKKAVSKKDGLDEGPNL